MSELNLVPYDLKRRSKSTLSPGEKTLLICVVAALLLLAIGLPILRLATINGVEKRLRKEIDAGKDVLKQSQELQKEIVSYKTHIALVDVVTKLKSDASGKIRGLQGYVVGDIKFNSLIWGNGLITIQAASNNYDSLCVFVANLQESKEYSNARISAIARDQNSTGYTCSISIKY